MLYAQSPQVAYNPAGGYGGHQQQWPYGNLPNFPYAYFEPGGKPIYSVWGKFDFTRDSSPFVLPIEEQVLNLRHQATLPELLGQLCYDLDDFHFPQKGYDDYRSKYKVRYDLPGNYDAFVNFKQQGPIQYPHTKYMPNVYDTLCTDGSCFGAPGGVVPYGGGGYGGPDPFLAMNAAGGQMVDPSMMDPSLLMGGQFPQAGMPAAPPGLIPLGGDNYAVLDGNANLFDLSGSTSVFG